MSRYRGPRLRLMRALGLELPGLSATSIEKRSYPPGQHGPLAKRRKPGSDYALRLREKQKVQFNYGLTERQLRQLVEHATRTKGNTGVMLVQLLERRLDNVVFRAGFGRTIPAARQLVSHGHVLVNGRSVDRPSYRVRRGDVVMMCPSSRALAQRALESGAGLETSWIEVDKAAFRLTVVSLPDDTFLPFALEPRLIIEHYSRAM
jgi:small subunit ribosomal protein S4